MTKYRRKPLEIHAIQWKGDNLDEVRDFLGDENLTPNSKNQLEIHDWTDYPFDGVNVGEYIAKQWEDAIHPEDWQYIYTYDKETFEDLFEVAKDD